MSKKVVYGWFDGETCFYIGLGGKRRPKVIQGRNNICLECRQQALKKGTFEVRILFQHLSIKQAQQKEKELIQQYGRLDLGTGTLTNLTNRGECSSRKETINEFAIFENSDFVLSPTHSIHRIGRKKAKVTF